ncbi:MAG: Muconolactone Delta-isomerase [Bacteroidota bacterium]|jgi:muconolactone D-isomerase
MHHVQVILTIDLQNLPENFQEILKEEQAVVAEWKEEGVLAHLFLRPERNGAVLQFINLSLEEVKGRMETLPFYHIRKSIEYYELLPQF